VLRNPAFSHMSVSMDPVWHVVANMTSTPRGGREEGKSYQGTPKFAPRTLLFVGEIYAGTCDAVHAIGRARDTRRFVNCVVNVKTLTDIRPKLIYSPSLLGKLPSLGAQSFADREKAEKFAETITFWLSL
jgi:hypothetical protein